MNPLNKKRSLLFSSPDRSFATELIVAARQVKHCTNPIYRQGISFNSAFLSDCCHWIFYLLLIGGIFFPCEIFVSPLPPPLQKKVASCCGSQQVLLICPSVQTFVITVSRVQIKFLLLKYNENYKIIWVNKCQICNLPVWNMIFKLKITILH